jgi:hypothetical protein
MFRALLFCMLSILACCDEYVMADSPPQAPDVNLNYTIHAVIRILNPVDAAAMNDGRQIVTQLRATDEYTEVSCTLFPLLQPTVTADADWRAHDAAMSQYIKSGPSANWDQKMQQDLIAALKSEGIDPDKLDDKQLVQRVSDWLLKKTTYASMFDTWFVGFHDNQPYVLPDLKEAFRRSDSMGNQAWSDEQQFEHELLGRSMFYNRFHGTCTSYAILQATVLKALGIPTRIFVTIPIADTNDESQIKMVSDNLHHHAVRSEILHGLEGTGYGFVGHTFNEVYVGGQWVTLNYNKLGQPMLNRDYAGLFVHIATLNDWADGNYAPTWGRRYAFGTRSDALPTSNPYRTLELSDQFGKDAHLENPEVVDAVPKSITVSKIYWQSDPDRSKSIAEPDNDVRGHLLLHVSEPDLTRDYQSLKSFLRSAGRDFTLRAEGQPPVTARITLGSVTSTPDVCEVFLDIPPTDYAKMVAGTKYTLELPNELDGSIWRATGNLTITKTVEK